MMISDDSHDVERGFDRLRELLLAIHPGENLRASDVSQMCGSTERACRTVLEGLERAGLMTHERDDRFVRKTLVLHGTSSGSAA